MGLTNAGAPIEVDGSGQTDCHTIPINSSEVASSEFLSRDISRRGVVSRGMSLIIRDLCPCQRSYVLGDVGLLEA